MEDVEASGQRSNETNLWNFVGFLVRCCSQHWSHNLVAPKSMHFGSEHWCVAGRPSSHSSHLGRASTESAAAAPCAALSNASRARGGLDMVGRGDLEPWLHDAGDARTEGVIDAQHASNFNIDNLLQ